MLSYAVVCHAVLQQHPTKEDLETLRVQLQGHMSGCRGLRPQANAKGQNSVSSDLRCMALAGWSDGTGEAGAAEQGPHQQARIVTASSDATMSLLHFDVHARRSVCMLTHAKNAFEISVDVS